MRATFRLVAAATLLLALVQVQAKKAGEGAVLADGYPPITEEERVLAEVSFARGAPAVVLQDVVQHRWDRIPGLEHLYTRIDHHRRLKILTQAGVEQFADYTYFGMAGDEEIQKILARTVLPDGQEVKAQVFKDWKEGKHASVRVVFAQVQPGAILDLRMTSSVPFLFSTRIPIQGTLPTLHARYVTVPPPNIDLIHVVATGIPRDRVDVRPFHNAFGTGSAYVVENIPAFDSEPFLPPMDDATMSFSLVFKYQSDSPGWASTWAAWAKEQKTGWDNWTHGQALQAKELARSATEGKTRALDKADAIRRAVQDRVRTSYLEGELDFFSPEQRAPDMVLSTGRGSIADVAGLQVTMLRAVGLSACLVPSRRRTSGRLDPDIPMPMLLDDMLVRVDTEQGPVYYNPSADLPVSVLPSYSRGVVAIPLDSLPQPVVKMPELRPEENRVARTSEAELLADGTVRGKTTEVYEGVAANAARGALRDLDDSKRKERLEEDLRRHMPGCTLASWSMQESPALSIRRAWEAPGLASHAGKRLLLDLNLHERVDPAAFTLETRVAPVDFGEVYEHLDTVVLWVPDGAGEVTLPEPVKLSLGSAERPNATYSLSYAREDGRVVMRRALRLGRQTFNPEDWPRLRSWFRQIVAAEEEPIAVNLP